MAGQANLWAARAGRRAAARLYRLLSGGFMPVLHAVWALYAALERRETECEQRLGRELWQRNQQQSAS